MAACCSMEAFNKGQTVVRQGGPGRELFVVRSGMASVLMDSGTGVQEKVTTLGEGSCFGEGALFLEEPWSASVRAETELITLKVSREKLVELGFRLCEDEGKRQAVRGITGDDFSAVSSEFALHQKEEQDILFVVESLQANGHLDTLGLDKGRVTLLANAAERQRVDKGVAIVRRGEDKADHLYVLQSGGLDVIAGGGSDQESEDEQPEERMGGRGSPRARRRRRKVGTLEPGDSFGELSLLYSIPSDATVQARCRSTLWSISRISWKRIIMRGLADQTDEYEALLASVKVFSNLSSVKLRALADALSEINFCEGEVILQQGQRDLAYVLVEGEVAVIKDGERVNTLTASRMAKAAHFFGDLGPAIITHMSPEVQVISKTATTLPLDRRLFELVSGSNGQGPEAHLLAQLNSYRSFQEVAIGNLERVGPLGFGAFGSIDLRRDPLSGLAYAVRAVSKGLITQAGLQHCVCTEKLILANVSSPFIVRLCATARSTQWIYFLLEPALGGNLYVLYRRLSLHGSLVHARYYSAGTVLALEHLHERNVLHRDVKPENLFLNSDGCVKLAGMGLAKCILGKTYTTCGTPDYMAPEVIRSLGQTHAVDWWALGVLVYELMTGSSPFCADTHMMMFAKVLRGIDCVQFPPRAEGFTGDFVRNVLREQPSERLPMRHCGIPGLKAHPWFQEFDWEGHMRGAVPAPYVPVVESQVDLRNFRHVKEQKVNWVEWQDDGSGWDANF